MSEETEGRHKDERGKEAAKEKVEGRWSHSIAGRKPKMLSSEGNWRGRTLRRDTRPVKFTCSL